VPAFAHKAFAPYFENGYIAVVNARYPFDSIGFANVLEGEGVDAMHNSVTSISQKIFPTI
jgi:hypothetical protein